MSCSLENIVARYLTRHDALAYIVRGWVCLQLFRVSPKRVSSMENNGRESDRYALREPWYYG